MEQLAGKRALVTGAAGPLGYAISKILDQDGLRVVMADVNAERVNALATELGDAAIPLVLDVSDDKAVAEACARIRDDHGPIDVLVNNAGILSNNKAAETSPEEWRNLMSICDAPSNSLAQLRSNTSL